MNPPPRFRKHFRRAGQETKRCTQIKPQSPTPGAPRRDWSLASEQHYPCNGPAHGCLVPRISVRPNNAFRGASDNGISCVKLETARNTVKVFDRRPTTVDGGLPQVFGGERVRCVLKQAPNVEHVIATVLYKHLHSTTNPEFYPGAKIPR